MSKFLSYEDRLIIAQRLQESASFGEIGKELGRDRTTIAKGVRKYSYDKKNGRPGYPYNPCKFRVSCKVKKCFFDKVKKYRLAKEVPVLEGFFAWLDAQTAIRGSRFDKALIYIRNRKPYLTNYLEDGGCSFSNNTSERSCKAFVTGSKNWLFSDTPKGAEASALVYSIVETAKANNVDIYYYLKYLLIKTPTKDMPDEEHEKLCPWHPECKNALEAMRLKDEQSPLAI